MQNYFTITQPDDWHVHVRDGAMMGRVIADTALHMGRAIIMPNLTPPITTTAAALSYRQRILDALPKHTSFQPLMTLYLTDQTTAEEIKFAAKTGHIPAAKLYPAGATTNAHHGVRNIEALFPVLEAMQEVGMILLMHGEVTTPSVDIFDREKYFIDEILTNLTRRLPKLKMVLEHITTAEAVAFVQQAPAALAATITAHHLLYNRNDMLVGGVRPHYYCLPILKRESHRLALLQAATSGSPKFFAGTDSAPHLKSKKEVECGCAGIYSSHQAVAFYAEAFDAAIDLNLPASQRLLEGFLSKHGADFYGLPHNRSTLLLTREKVHIPASIETEEGTLIPLRAGEFVAWNAKIA